MGILSSLPRVEPQQIRQILSELLRSDADLDAFCLDCFREIYQRFSDGMTRTQKENLLLLHALTPDDIVAALQLCFPHSTIWHRWPTVSRRFMDDQRHRSLWTPARKLLALSSIMTAVLCVSVWRAWPLMHRTVQRSVHAEEPAEKTGCDELSMDDLFIVKNIDPAQNHQLALDVRLRYSGTVPNAANVTRAVLWLSDKTFQRTPYSPSAAYDLLVTGDRSEVALAQRVGLGEIDRIVLRLGFTPETASFQYNARLQLFYNGSCNVESAPFILSSSVAPWPGET